MAMLKVISQKFSLGSTNAGGCLSWCFGSGQQGKNPDRSEYEDPNDADSGTGSRTPPPPYPEIEHMHEHVGEGGRVSEVELGEEGQSSPHLSHREVSDVLDGDSYSNRDTLEKDRRVIPNGRPCSELSVTASERERRSASERERGSASEKERRSASERERGSASEKERGSRRGSSPSSVRPGSTTSASDVNAGRQNGSAYAYDDAETSSDSDDEVLRRYHQTMGMQRAPSKHSIRSARSTKSTTSKTSKASKAAAKVPAGASKHVSSATESPSPAAAADQDLLLSQVEQGQAPTPEVHPQHIHSDADLSGPEDGLETDPIIPPSSRATSVAETGHISRAESAAAASDTRSIASPIKPAAHTSEKKDEEPLAATTSTHEYQNDAFAGTDEVSPADHVSDHVSAYGDTASMSIGDVEQDEHLFDVSDLQDREQVIISKCGNLEVSFSYSYERSRMSVTVHRALEIPSKDRGGANNAQIRLLLLPTKKVRHKTKIKPGENPEFNETFSIKVPPEEINNMGVRFRLYGCERMRRERMIGESVIGFASLNQDEETTHMLQLEPRSNLSHGDSNLDVASLSRSDSASSTQSMQHGGMPELLVGLAYNGTTGRLCVEVIKGSNFRNMAMNRAPDTYVKLTLMSPTGQEIARSKTSIRRGQPNPLYKETFMFQVALFQLPEVTLMTSVYNKRSMKRKEMIGWFSLGKNNSGEEELAHWNDMRESKGEQVCRWHVLLES